MKIDRNKIVKFCRDYLKADNFKDYCVNGLQVEGREKVGKIITGVSLSQKLIEEAVKKRADMVMVHHGIFSNQVNTPPAILGVLKNRLKLLLENNLNLCGFHLPLDAHPVIGNNISLLKLFNLKKIEVLGSAGYGDIGYMGELAEAKGFKDFLEMVNNKLNTDSYYIFAGKKKVKKVGIISGGASTDFQEAAKAGAEVFLCGDIREEVVRAVEEVKINFINAGHYNTEKLGIQNLGDLVAKKFKVKVEFVDVPCEI